MDKRLLLGDKQPRSLIALSLLLLSVLTYGRFIGNYFTSEDFIYLYRSVIAPGYLSFFSPAQGNEWLDGRFLPILMSFYRLGYKWFNLNPLGYHLLILVLHAINSYLVFLISEKIFKSRYKAYFVAVINATYSLHITTVIWLSCANYVLAAFGFLLSFYLFILYMETLKGVKFFFFIVFFVFAIFCHEVSYTLPLVILLYLFLYPPQWKVLRRADNILFLAIPILTIYAALFYIQYLFSPTMELVNTRLANLWQNPHHIILKPLLGMAVMMIPEINPDNWLFGLISKAAYVVDNYPVLAQFLFVGLIALSFLDRASCFGLFFYMLVSIMMHFSSFGALNNYYIASIGFIFFTLGLLFRLAPLISARLNSEAVLQWGAKLGYRGVKMWHLSGFFLLVIVSINIFIAQERGIAWREGGEIARKVLTGVQNRYPNIPPDSRLFLFDVPAIDQKRRVNIFRYRTISDAFRLLYKDPSLDVHNIETNKIYLNPRTIHLNGGYLYLPSNQLLDLTHNPQIARLFKYLKRPSFIFDQRFPTSRKFYFRYQDDALSESKIKRPIDFSRLFEVQL